jgi:hypothetical protein
VGPYEYGFDVIHQTSRVNWKVNGLSQNPSSNEDAIGVHYHGDVDLEIVPN